MTGADETTIAERYGRVSWALAEGQHLTVREVMEMTGMAREGARDLLYRLSHVVSITPVRRGNGPAIWMRTTEALANF